MKLNAIAPWKESYDKPWQYIKKLRHHFADKCTYSQSYGFSSCPAQMWELDHKEGWVPKNWSFWTVMLEKTLESHLDSKEIKPVILKEINPDYSLEVLMLQLQWFATWWEELTHWKRAWCWERLKAKGQAEDVIVKWHHQISGYEFEQTPGGREGQGSLAYCSPWRHKELDTT